MANAGRKGTVSDGFSLNYLLLIAYFSPRRAGLNAENALNTFHSVFNGSPVKKITNRERDPCGPQSLSLFAMWIPYKGPDFPTLRSARATAPPCCPVAPKTRNSAVLFMKVLHSNY
jgi:hypothetical protein